MFIEVTNLKWIPLGGAGLACDNEFSYQEQDDLQCLPEKLVFLQHTLQN